MASQAVEFPDDDVPDGADAAALEKGLQRGPVEGLAGEAFVHQDLRQIQTLRPRVGLNPVALRVQAHALAGLRIG